MNDNCKNCGGPRGLHHYQTLQCPVGGREAPIGRKQEWMTLTFEPDTRDELQELRAELAELKAKYEIVINKLARLYEKEMESKP